MTSVLYQHILSLFIGIKSKIHVAYSMRSTLLCTQTINCTHFPSAYVTRFWRTQKLRCAVTLYEEHISSDVLQRSAEKRVIINPWKQQQLGVKSALYCIKSSVTLATTHCNKLLQQVYWALAWIRRSRSSAMLNLTPLPRGSDTHGLLPLPITNTLFNL